MKVGFALSPGGLMLPYHMGALSSLQYNGYLTDHNPVSGSSAGAIATMAYGCGVDANKVLEATIQVSDDCHDLGGARGRLLPLLEQQMEDMVGEEEFLHLQEQRDVGIAYTQVFPQKQSYLQTEFEKRDDLFRAVGWSCMFPFFATNWPCQVDTSKGFPRLMVDGFFSVPRDRFGCPEFDSNKVDRTIGISVFPKNTIKLDAFDEHDSISPSPFVEEDGDVSMEDLFRIATQASSREDLTKVYELGFKDAEKWCREEDRRQKRKQDLERELRRKDL